VNPLLQNIEVGKTQDPKNFFSAQTPSRQLQSFNPRTDFNPVNALESPRLANEFNFDPKKYSPNPQVAKLVEQIKQESGGKTGGAGASPENYQSAKTMYYHSPKTNAFDSFVSKTDTSMRGEVIPVTRMNYHSEMPSTRRTIEDGMKIREVTNVPQVKFTTNNNY
jgi:hypothetical protein